MSSGLSETTPSALNSMMENARTRNFLEGVSEVDHDILETIRGMSSHLEVRARTAAEWQQAILVGFRVWRDLRKGNGGCVTVDLQAQQLFYASAPAQRKTATSKGPRTKKAGKRRGATVVKTRRGSTRLQQAANDK